MPHSPAHFVEIGHTAHPGIPHYRLGSALGHNVNRAWIVDYRHQLHELRRIRHGLCHHFHISERIQLRPDSIKFGTVGITALPVVLPGKFKFMRANAFAGSSVGEGYRNGEAPGQVPAITAVINMVY